MAIKEISSAQNPFVKMVDGLSQARERRQSGLFVVEGLRETALALRAGYALEHLLFCPDYISLPELEQALQAPDLPEAKLVSLSAAVFDKLSYRKGIANVLAVCRMRFLSLDALQLSDNPLLLVLESVEKPGNLGAMLRSADAAGLDAVLICDPHTDIYNPNVIRASLGALFSRQVLVCESLEAIKWLKTKGISLAVTHLEASLSYDQSDLSRPVALVMGAEAGGISDLWLQQADRRIIIPMYGQVDSMNVSASAAVLMFEALRQRRGKGVS